jgi:hypothetical protein
MYDHGAAGPAHAPLPDRGGEQNESHRFMHSTAVVKAREQAKKAERFNGNVVICACSRFLCQKIE